MSIRIGRVTLSDPIASGTSYRRGSPNTSLAGPAWEDAFDIEGRESATDVQTTMTSLEKEARRRAALWCEADNAEFPSGHYVLVDGSYDKRGGAPKRRPWRLAIESRRYDPVIVRQAEDDNVAGTDTADQDADEASRVDYVTTNAYAAVLDPRNVSGAEKLNVPKGTWKVTLLGYGVGTATAQVRWKATKTNGTLIGTGSDVAVSPADAWKEFDLGDLVVPEADHKANWFVVEVRDVTNPGSVVRLDRVVVSRVA